MCFSSCPDCLRWLASSEADQDPSRRRRNQLYSLKWCNRFQGCLILLSLAEPKSTRLFSARTTVCSISRFSRCQPLTLQRQSWTTQVRSILVFFLLAFSQITKTVPRQFFLGGIVKLREVGFPRLVRKHNKVEIEEFQRSCLWREVCALKFIQSILSFNSWFLQLWFENSSPWRNLLITNP